MEHVTTYGNRKINVEYDESEDELVIKIDGDRAILLQYDDRLDLFFTVVSKKHAEVRTED